MDHSAIIERFKSILVQARMCGLVKGPVSVTTLILHDFVALGLMSVSREESIA